MCLGEEFLHRQLVVIAYVNLIHQGVLLEIFLETSLRDHLNLLGLLLQVSLCLSSSAYLQIASLLSLFRSKPSLGHVALDVVIRVNQIRVDSGFANYVLNIFRNFLRLGLLDVYCQLMLFHLSGDMVSVEGQRIHGSYLHSHAVNCFVSSIRLCEEYDGRKFVTQVVVCVYASTLQEGVLREFHLLTGNAGTLGNQLSYGHAVNLESLERLEVSRFLLHCNVQNLLGQCYEISILGHEVGLALESYDCSKAVLSFRQNATFRSLAVGTLGCDCLSALTQKVFRGLEVAVCLFQSFLYIHHTCARNITQFLNIS